MNEIKISPVSNREDYSESWQAIDDDGEPIDLTGATIVFQVAEPGTGGCIVATADVDIDTTTFTASIDVATMRGLCPKEYRVGCTIDQGDGPAQFFVGSFPVYDGVVA